MPIEERLDKYLSKPRKGKSPTATDFYAKEWVKCRQNPLYFALNYVIIPEIGGELKLSSELLHPKQIRVIKSVYKYHKAILMASRQLGKSTISAILLSWALVFYPNNTAIILNMKQKAGLQNLGTIKFIIRRLPEWMVTKHPFKQKSDIKTYFDLFNGSHCDVFYPSTIHTSSTLARSLTSPILYIDEAAFIKDMAEIYGSAQQTLSKAREQAQKNNYPYFQLITTTPNGIQGVGEWFYKRWGNAIESDSLFIEDPETSLENWNTHIDIPTILKDDSKNSFIKIQYHWSEDPTKTQEWYNEQCRELDDQRKVNQELDLVFVGSTHCLFSDEILSKFTSSKPCETIYTSNVAPFHVFEQNLDTTDYYLIGVDTAESLEGAYCSIQIFSFREFKQIGELEFKYGSYTKFAEDIHYIFQWLYAQVGVNIILCNENNTIGRAPIELLLNRDDFDYLDFFYVENPSLDKLYKGDVGVKTTGLTKPLMVGCFIEYVKDNETCIKSQDLINQISAIEKTPSGSIKCAIYSDLFMSTCFCAYVRKKMAVEIMPIITLSQKDQAMKVAKDVDLIISVNKTPKSDSSKSDTQMTTTDSDSYNYDETDISIYLPTF